MASYFVKRQSKVLGPVGGQNILDLAKSGKIHPTDEIATDKNGPWKPVTSIGPLQAVFGEPADALQPLTSSSSQLAGQPHVASGVSQKAPNNGFGMGTRSVHKSHIVWGIAILLFPLGTVLFIILVQKYGWPSICKIPLATGSSAAPVEAIVSLFLRKGFTKRTQRITTSAILKCPGAIVAMRDVRIKQKKNAVYVMGWQNDIAHILAEAGLLS